MSRSLTAVLLIAALAAPGFAQARQITDAEIAAKLSAAYQRGQAQPKPPASLADEGMCASAWGAVAGIYTQGNYATPPGLEDDEIDWQGQLWFDRLVKKGPAGEAAMKTAEEALIKPLTEAQLFENVMEIAGSCGTTG